MRNFVISTILSSLLAGVAVGQCTHIGNASVSWPNNYGSGSASLDADIYYPAICTGLNAPAMPSSGGHPVVVFLHGWGKLGSDYYRIGRELASMGMVAVMLNTARHSYTLMEEDTKAMFGAIHKATSTEGAFFQGSMDMSRVGLMGHSMGGAVLALVLNESPLAPSKNPGYKCALGIAPVDPALAVANTVVTVPIGLVSGLGDTLTPPYLHATPYYNSLVPAAGLKFHYKMDSVATHMNLVGLGQVNPVIFERCLKIVSGFFGQFFSDKLEGLETVLGVDGLAEPHLVSLDKETVVPQAWSDGQLRVGSQTRISVSAEAGFAGLIVASDVATPTQTSVGSLLLDPSSAVPLVETLIVGSRLDVIITVPALSQLIGTSFAVQGGGATINEPFKLGSAISFTIGS